MKSKSLPIVRTKKLDPAKMSKAKGLSQSEQFNAAFRQKLKIKSGNSQIEEFDEWK